MESSIGAAVPPRARPEEQRPDQTASAELGRTRNARGTGGGPLRRSAFRVAAGLGLAGSALASGAHWPLALLALVPGLVAGGFGFKPGVSEHCWRAAAAAQALAAAALAAAFPGQAGVLLALWALAPLLEPGAPKASTPLLALCMSPLAAAPIAAAAAGEGSVGPALGAAAFGLLAFFALVFDQNSRLRAEENEAETRAAMALIEEHGGDALLKVDADGRVRAAHGAMRGVFGFASAETLGKPLEALVAAEDAAELRLALEGALYQEAGRKIRLRGHETRRAEEPLDFSLWPLGPPRPGALFECLILARDARDAMEQERKLTEAVQHAQAAQASKSRFLANMSHEFRTPLNAILGFAELLRHQHDAQPANEPLNGQQIKPHLDAILEGGRQLLRLVEDLLALAEEDRPSRRSKYEQADVIAIFADCAALSEGAAQKRGVRLEFAPAPVVLQADPRALTQTLRGLVSQAVTFTSPGGAVRISAEAGPNEGKIVIDDEGVGMSEEMLRRVREPFLAERTAYVDIGFGATLRLAGAMRLVESMGGRMEIDSAPHRGTTVTLTLPLAEAQEERPAATN